MTETIKPYVPADNPYREADRMEPEVKALWVEALLSGEYKQGAHYLHVGDRYCCLGVLANVAVKQGLDIQVRAECTSPFGHAKDETYVLYDDDGQVLGENIMQWAGLHFNNPEIKAERLMAKNNDNSLAGLNDSGFTFEEIAHLIDEYL